MPTPSKHIFKTGPFASSAVNFTKRPPPAPPARNKPRVIEVHGDPDWDRKDAELKQVLSTHKFGARRAANAVSSEESSAATKIQAKQRQRKAKLAVDAKRDAREQNEAAGKIQGVANNKKKRKQAQEKMMQSFLDQADKIFNAIDTDGGGTVDQAELIAGMKSNKSLMRMVRKADPSLKMAMKDQMRADGMITRDGFYDFVGILCIEIYNAQEASKRRKDGILKQAVVTSESRHHCRTSPQPLELVRIRGQDCHRTTAHKRRIVDHKLEAVRIDNNGDA